jgi:hypothetical protein
MEEWLDLAVDLLINIILPVLMIAWAVAICVRVILWFF